MMSEVVSSTRPLSSSQRQYLQQAVGLVACSFICADHCSSAGTRH